MLSYDAIKPWLFKLDPERAHHLTEYAARAGKYCSFMANRLIEENFITDPMLSQEYFGKTFLNPVGLAAGFDKNATMFPSLPMAGFGFIEVGTITPLPQVGNDKPRLFRFPEAEAVQNAMGFNNDGMEKIASRVEKRYPFSLPLGINIGKNKMTSAEEAISDYEKLVQRFKLVSDFFIVNISSPNTPGLRDLQNEGFIKELLERLKRLSDVPILIKIAPDMEIDQALSLIGVAIDEGVDGIIANNTSNDYDLLENAKDFGGISGAVITEKSREFFDKIAEVYYGKTFLVSVGGISDAKEAYRRIRAGANLVEVYTSLIFKGPSLVKQINLGLIDYLKSDGFTSIHEAIGVDR